MFNKAWTLLLNENVSTGNTYNTVPGAFLIDPTYQQVCDDVNNSIDVLLFGDNPDVYFKVWRARNYLHLLRDSGLLKQLESSDYHYDLDRSWSFMNLPPFTVIPEGNYQYCDICIEGTLFADETNGILQRSWAISRVGDTIHAINATNTHLYSAVTSTNNIHTRFNLPNSPLIAYIQNVDGFPDNGVFTINALACGSFNPVSFLAKLKTNAARGRVEKELQSLSLMHYYETHPLVWVRVACVIAAVCRVREANG